MTIDERVNQLMDNPWLSGNTEQTTERRSTLIRAAMLEVARDQRHLCAEQVLQRDYSDMTLDPKERAHQAVMNTPLPK